MNRKVLKDLKEYIKNHSYGKNADYTLQSLFYAYESRTINSIENLYAATEDFVKFLIFNKQKILNSISDHNSLYREYFEKEYDMILLAFNHVSDPYHIASQAKFVHISQLLYSDKNARLLDVGSGMIPFSSFLFTSNYTNVSSMDKFLLSNEFLEAQNLTPYNQYYTNHTDVSDFDFVVGRRPCSAIPSIVKTCAKENKPYFIELCDCHLEHITLPDGSQPVSWNAVLPDFDPNIKFVADYAYNIDISKSQTLKLIESMHPELFNDTYGNFGCFVAMSILLDCFNELENELSFNLNQ